MRAKTKDELAVDDKILVYENITGKRRLCVHTVTEITEDDVIVDNLYDIAPNEDEQYIVLPKN